MSAKHPRSQCVAIVAVSKYNRVAHRCPFQTSGNTDMCGGHLRTKRLREERIAKRAAIETAMDDLVSLGSAMATSNITLQSLYLSRIDATKNIIRAGLK